MPRVRLPLRTRRFAPLPELSGCLGAASGPPRALGWAACFGLARPPDILLGVPNTLKPPSVSRGTVHLGARLWRPTLTATVRCRFELTAADRSRHARLLGRRLAIRHDWQGLDLRPCRLLRKAQLVGRLQIGPKLGAIAEPMPKAQGGVAGDRPLARDPLSGASLGCGPKPSAGRPSKLSRV